MPYRTIEEVGMLTIFWDDDFQRNGVIHDHRPDNIVLNKSTNNCHIIVVAIANEPNISNKMIEKIKKKSDLKVEMANLFGIGEENVIVIGSLISIPLKLCDILNKLELSYELGVI